MSAWCARTFPKHVSAEANLSCRPAVNETAGAFARCAGSQSAPTPAGIARREKNKNREESFARRDLLVYPMTCAFALLTGRRASRYVLARPKRRNRRPRPMGTSLGTTGPRSWLAGWPRVWGSARGESGTRFLGPSCCAGVPTDHRDRTHARLAHDRLPTCRSAL
jgi:hypothetical protein